MNFSITIMELTPTELLWAIGFNLSAKDIGNLVLVCKRLCNCLGNGFAKKWIKLQLGFPCIELNTIAQCRAAYWLKTKPTELLISYYAKFVTSINDTKEKYANGRKMSEVVLDVLKPVPYREELLAFMLVVSCIDRNHRSINKLCPLFITLKNGKEHLFKEFRDRTNITDGTVLDMSCFFSLWEHYCFNMDDIVEVNCQKAPVYVHLVKNYGINMAKKALEEGIDKVILLNNLKGILTDKALTEL